MSTFLPRTYGSDVRAAFLSQYAPARSWQVDVTTAIETVANQAAAEYGSSLLSVLRGNRYAAVDRLNAAMPRGCTFPDAAFDDLITAIGMLPAVWAEVTPAQGAIAPSLGMANSDWMEMWADVRRANPPHHHLEGFDPSADHAVDDFQSRLSRFWDLSGPRLAKHVVALLIQEWVRTHPDAHIVSAEKRTPVSVGGYVKILHDRPYGAQTVTGAVVRIDSVGVSSFRGTAVGGGTSWTYDTDMEGTHWEHTDAPAGVETFEPGTDTVAAPVNPDVADALADAARWKTLYDSKVTDYRSLESEYESAIETISDVFIEEANNRNWCSEYDSIIANKVNPSLGRFEMKTRAREVEMTVNGYIRVPFSYSFTVETTTDSITDDGVDWVNNNLSASDLLRDGSIDRYSAEIEEDFEIDEA